MSAVFLDTVGLLAVWDEADQWHHSAETAFRRIISQRLPFRTTTFILVECGNAAARRPYRLEVDVLRSRLESRGELVVPTADDWSLAWDDYRAGQAGDAGIVDHVSFVVMRRLGIADAFTNDRHFQAAGFNTLF